MRHVTLALLFVTGCARPPSEEIPMRAPAPATSPAVTTSGRPAIDEAVPARLETATFALG